MNCLELVLAVPKPHRMNVLLKEHEREKGHEEDEDESFRTISLFSKAKQKRFTLEDAQVELLASEQGITQAFKDKHLPTMDIMELPTGPAIRFADLFLMRERWEALPDAEHIKPYLSDIAVDTKDLDRLLLKYAEP
ncbi:hypothetical protein BGY98DRAFT_1187842 [Russula aff. rugulosa BPL654]|nr:hypothetical protein BGY98DRAFT_1187842 [Russula aff. rugulosa BPL654]